MSLPDGAGVLVVIPARLAAARLPGKPLLDRTGKPLIQHVWESARRLECASVVLVATDSERIADAVRGFGGDAVMTSADCPSGTDRVAEAARGRTEALVVNLQGDEPEFHPGDVDRLVAEMAADASVPLGTLAAVAEAGELEEPSVVKVVRDVGGNALYFSRAGIPCRRDAGADESGADEPPAPALRHIGVYVFRREALAAFSTLAPTPLERTERLEQLRALENGWTIRVVVGRRSPPGIDTPQDYEAFCARHAAQLEESST